MMKRSRNIRNQTISAILMALLGTAVHAGAQSYLSAYDIKDEESERKTAAVPPAALEVRKPAETETVPETEEAVAEETEKEVFSPSLSALNLAYLSLAGPEEEAGEESVAGQIIRELSMKDSEWLASIYELSVGTPEEAAVKSGLPAEAVRGLYNPLDESQKEDDPKTWRIPEWSNIDMAFMDENGNRIMADSNIKEIMALANTYFYYSDPEDGSAFYDYAMKLWNQSHSVQYSVGEVYYCDGCLEDMAAAGGMEDGGAPDDSADTGTKAHQDELTELAAAASEQPQSVEIGPGITTAAENTSTVEAAMAATPEAALEPAAETAPETAAASPENTTEAVAAIGSMNIPEASSAHESAPDSDLAASGQMAGNQETVTEEIGPGIALMKAAAAAAASSAAQEEEMEPVKCPGHVDLHITATIAGFSNSDRSLFAMAEGLGGAGGDSGFAGWNEINRNAAAALAEQDWKAAYGLTVSAAYIMNPLSASETEYYLSLLPADITEERKRLIRCALSSVGKIPYYWGGKPAAPDYEGNYFGSLTAADEKGRTMRGLDCSGWISWVYWSATGKRLPAESTEGLSQCGTAVAREDLKPGDIIVRLGEEGHVVMFLAWETDGKMKVLHESAGSVNNVTVSTMLADWPYYRKLID